MKNDPLVEILRKDLANRRAKNRLYSLRSFSLYLGVDPSNLSKILNYQKEVGTQLRVKLAEKIGFNKNEIHAFLRPATFSNTTDQSYTEHNLQIFQIVSEWQHYAILEVFKLSDFHATPESIAQRLGLTTSKTRESLRNLVDAKLLLETKDGYKIAETSSSSILTTATSKAHRQQQKEILESAIQALESVPLERRSQSSITMAVDSRKIEKAKELIKSFRRDLGRLMSESMQLDEVYQLSVSFFPVTKSEIKKYGKKFKGERL